MAKILTIKVFILGCQRCIIFLWSFQHLCFLVAAKYDVAISTACAGLDYIVVETTASAQACVDLLRAQNLGVATFMILVSFPFQTNWLYMH